MTPLEYLRDVADALEKQDFERWTSNDAEWRGRDCVVSVRAPTESDPYGFVVVRGQRNGCTVILYDGDLAPDFPRIDAWVNERLCIYDPEGSGEVVAGAPWLKTRFEEYETFRAWHVAYGPTRETPFCWFLGPQNRDGDVMYFGPNGERAGKWGTRL